MTFEPIGPKATELANGARNEDGTKRGKEGAVTSFQNTSVIAAYLARHSPEDMDKAALSRMSSHGVECTVRKEGRYPSGPNGERLPSYDVAVGCEICGTNAQREAAMADLLKFQTPAPVREIEGWLAELSVITASRRTEGVSAELLVTAYASRLSRYPADVAKAALLDFSWKWFPTWEELEKTCEAKASPRRHMIAALSQPEPDPEPIRRPPTQEERNRIQAMVDEMFPNKSDEDRKAAVDITLRGDCMTGAAE